MPHSEAARIWLDEAALDLEWIESTSRSPSLHRRLCWAAQQAAEKAIKAVLTYHGERFGKTHDLRVLLRKLEPVAGAPPRAGELIELTDYSEDARYPDDPLTVPPATAAARTIGVDELDRAIELARLAYEWAEPIVYASDAE